MSRFAMGDVSLSVPDGFALHMVVLAGKPKAQFSRNVVLAREAVPPGTQLEAYQQAQLKMLMQGSSGVSVVKKSTLPIDGAQCPVIETEAVGPGGLPLSSLIAYVKKGDVVFTLTATNVKGSAFNETREELTEILKSFVAKA